MRTTISDGIRHQLNAAHTGNEKQDTTQIKYYLFHCHLKYRITHIVSLLLLPLPCLRFVRFVSSLYGGLMYVDTSNNLHVDVLIIGSIFFLFFCAHSLLSFVLAAICLLAMIYARSSTHIHPFTGNRMCVRACVCVCANHRKYIVNYYRRSRSKFVAFIMKVIKSKRGYGQSVSSEQANETVRHTHTHLQPGHIFITRID